MEGSGGGLQEGIRNQSIYQNCIKMLKKGGGLKMLNEKVD